MTNEQITSAWRAVFSKSYISVQPGALGGGLYCKGHLQAPGEWSNGISQNDPLSFMFCIEGGEYTEAHGNILLNPENNYMYACSKAWRKKTIKDINQAKLEKRFNEIKSFILSHKSSWHNAYADIIGYKIAA